MKIALAAFTALRANDYFAWLGAPAAFIASLSANDFASYCGGFAGLATGFYYLCKNYREGRAKKTRPPFKPLTPRDP